MGRTPATRLFHRDFVLLWQGQLVSQVGSQAFAIATAFWIKRETDSAGLVGLAMMLGTLPIVALGPVGGVVADLASRKRIIVVCDLVAGLAVLTLAAVLVWPSAPTPLVVAWLCAVSVVVGVARAFFGPALRAAIPALAPPARLAAANSLNEGSTEAAALVGQAAGGVAFRALGAPALLLIDGLSYLAAACATGAVRIPQERAVAETGLVTGIRRARAEFVDGYRFVRNQRGLPELVTVAAAVNFFAAPVFVMLPFFAEDTLASGPELYGFLVAAFGGGGLVGYAVAGRIQPVSRARALLATLVAIAACLSLLGWAPNAPVALALFLCAGAGNGYFGVNVITILQDKTPDSLRGRVFGLLHTLAMGLTPLAMLLAGLVADAVDCDARAVFFFCGGILIAVTVAASQSRALRDYLE
jgi:MFS family permease